MGFFRDVTNNLLSMIFLILAIASMAFGFISCFAGGIIGGPEAGLITFGIFFFGGLVLLAFARAFAKRG